MVDPPKQNATGPTPDQSGEEMLPLVYGELRRLASIRMAKLPPGQTLQPTALVHEVYLKLAGAGDPGWNSRGHFFGAAAQAMREILVDHVRRRSAKKRGAGHKREALVDQPAAEPAFAVNEEEIIGIDAAMGQLRAEHPRKAEVVMLRYFAGLSNEQTAEALGVTTRTVARDWRFAQAWFHRQLATPSDCPPPPEGLEPHDSTGRS